MSQQGGYSYEKELRKYTKNKVMKSVIGNVSISYDIDCPHCDYNIDDYYYREWWDKNIFLEDGWSSVHEVNCPKCNKEFEVNGFQQ